MTTRTFINNISSIKKLSTCLYLYHYSNREIFVLLDSDSENKRADIIKNKSGIWKLHYNKYLVNYSLTKSEIVKIKKEIKKFNEYECDNIESFFKDISVKDISKYRQMSIKR